MTPKITNALILFARAPRVGHTKTRLIPALGAARAAEIYSTLLTHAIDCAEAVPEISRFLFADSLISRDYFSDRLSPIRWRCEVQHSGDLGARMAAALSKVLAVHPRAVLTGSDIVDMHADDVTHSLSRLAEGDDVVLGPVADGGYWLIGLKAPRPELFTSMAWGTSTIYHDTVQRIKTADLRWSALLARHDIDTPEDVAAFLSFLTPSRLAGDGRADSPPLP